MRPRTLLLLVTTILFLISLYSALNDPVLHGDESWHYQQISRFAQRMFVPIPWLAMFPTYHLLMALPGLPEEVPPSPALVRFLSFCTGLICIGVFYKAAQKIDPQSSFIKSMQFAFFPILFPMFFVIYTDVLSLAFLLLAFYFTLQRKSLAAGFFALAATAVRQNNVLWIVFLAVLILLEDGWNARSRRRLGALMPAFLLIAAFLLFHHSPALSDPNHNPISFNAGNIYFFLFLSFFLFLPFQFSNATGIARLFHKHKFLFVLIPAFYLIAIFSFHPDHPYNQAEFSYYLRNRVLLFFSSSLPLKALFLLPAAYTLCAFLACGYGRKFELLLIFTALFLLPLWLIEQRYYLIPFTLFMAMRRPLPPSQEYASLTMNVFLALTFLAGIVGGHFFL